MRGFFYHFRGVSDRDAARRDIAHDHRSSPDHASVSYRNAGADDSPGADPHIVADGNGQHIFERRTALFGINGMLRRVDQDARRKHDVAADPHLRPVEDHAIEIDEDMIAEMDVVSVIALERRHDQHALPHSAQQAGKNILAPVQLVWTRAVVFKQ